MGEIKISGLSELAQRMQNIARKTRNQSARKAMNAGASALKQEIKHRVPILRKQCLIDAKAPSSAIFVLKRKCGAMGKSKRVFG